MSESLETYEAPHTDEMNYVHQNTGTAAAAAEQVEIKGLQDVNDDGEDDFEILHADDASNDGSSNGSSNNGSSSTSSASGEEGDIKVLKDLDHDIEDLKWEKEKAAAEEAKNKEKIVDELVRLKSEFRTWTEIRSATIKNLRAIADYIDSVSRK
jgi:hypothetical protein